MKGLNLRLKKVLFSALVSGGLFAAILAPTTPASAALLPARCASVGLYGDNLDYCIIYVNNRAFARVQNRTSQAITYVPPVKLELAYYAKQSGDGFVPSDARTEVIQEVWAAPLGVATTPLPGYWTINPGWYCARIYIPSTGFWQDQICFSDTGGYWFGKYGYGKKYQ
jgi:hypothetical protein